MDIDSKEISTTRVTDDALITPHSADLLQMILTASTPTCQCQVYDGENAQGDMILDIKENYTISLEFPGGLYMRRGIYFANQTKTLSATFRWRHRPSKEG